MNSKKNSKIGDLAENVAVTIAQEKSINQDVHNVKGVVYESGIINVLMYDTDDEKFYQISEAGKYEIEKFEE